MRILKRIVFIFLGLIVLLISIGVGLAWYFEDNVRQIVLEELNKRLNQDKATLEIEEVNLTLIKKFPYATIDFENAVLKLKSSHKNKAVSRDTLFCFGHIYLEFSIKDLFEKNYSIKKVELKKGSINWKIDEKGKDNTDIWKASTDSTSKDFRFALNSVVVKECFLHYLNFAKQQKAQVVIDKLFLKGDFSTAQFDVTSTCVAQIKNLVNQDVNYIKDKDIAIDLRLQKKNNEYQIQEGKLLLENQLLSIDGNVSQKNTRKSNASAYVLNLKLAAHELAIDGLIDLLPEHYKKQLNDYRSTGVLNCVATIKGNYNNIESPEIIAGFEIKGGEFTYIPTSVTMDQIYIKGSYTNGKLKIPQSNCIEITSFSAQLGNGNMSGSCSFRNFSDPLATLAVHGNLSLADWQQFVPIDSIETLQGNASFDIQLAAEFRDSIRLSALQLNSVKTTGSVHVDGFSLHVINKKLQLNDCQLSLMLAENELLIDNLEGKILNSDIKMSGLIENLLPHLVKDEVYSITGIVQSNYINLNELLISNGGYALRLPDSISVALRLKVDKLEFRKFKASQLSGQFILDNRKLVANDLSLQAFDGSIQAYGSVETRENNQLFVSCDAGIDNINIQTLFDQCENFNQTHIQSKHLKGMANAQVHFASMWNENLTVQPDKIYSSIDLTIEKGELINFETLKALSKFVSMDELLHVQFSTLHNVIEIKNKAVYIPEMELHSSALNISLSGVQTFNNEIEYHFKILLSELLAQKFKKNRKKKHNDEDFGEIEDDGSGKASIYLTMTKTVDDPKVSFDKKIVLKKAKMDMQEEGRTLKTIVKDEFKWRADDTLAKGKRVKSPGLLFDWNDKEHTKNGEDEDAFIDTTSHLSKTQLKRKQALEEFKKSVFKKGN